MIICVGVLSYGGPVVSASRPPSLLFIIYLLKFINNLWRTETHSPSCFLHVGLVVVLLTVLRARLLYTYRVAQAA